MMRTHVSLLLLSLASFSAAAVHDYEGIEGLTNIDQIDGFTYTNATAMPLSYWTGEMENTSGFASGTGALVSSWDSTIEITRDTPFKFVGGYFSTWAYQDQFFEESSTTVTMTGYMDGEVTGSVTFRLGQRAQDYAGAGFEAMRLVLTADTPSTYWIADDLEFAEVNAVPEPASLAALVLGGLALRRRRKHVG